LEIRLGKNHRGYGQAVAYLIPDEITHFFQGCDLSNRISEIDEPITLTFLSDTIVQDKWGRHVCQFSDKSLSDQLGISVKIINQYMYKQTKYGFNNHLGLPKQWSSAIKAGSAIGFKIADENKNKEEVFNLFSQLELSGIGCEKQCGYGQIVFNWPIYKEWRPDSRNSFVSLSSEKEIGAAKCAIKVFQFIKLFLEETIQEMLESCSFKHSNWNSIARWLFMNKDQSFDSLIAVIENFEESDSGFSKIIQSKELDRIKERFFTDKLYDYRQLKKAIYELKEKLDKNRDISDTDKRSFKQISIKYIADYISEHAKGGK
jgi:hypothetical protein